MGHNKENIKKNELPQFKSRTFRFIAKYFSWPLRMFLRGITWIQMRPLKKVHAFLAKSERIDIVPLRSGRRGFIIIVDQTKALHFYQDGNGFQYEGYEIGYFEKGDVAIFDDIKS
jgi:hypothetical protein